jgi:hypothetical protein
MGRPSKYTPELWAEIVERVSAGEPLHQVCRDEHMPSASAVYDWTDEREECRPQGIPATLSLDFMRARLKGHDAIAAETLVIADDDSRDWEPVKNADGDIIGVKVDGEHVTRSKLRIETRLKLLAKWDKRYADKVAVGGTDDLPPIKTESMSDLEFARRMAFAMEQGLMAQK